MATTVIASPHIVTSALGAYSVSQYSLIAHAYEEGSTGVALDMSVKTGDKVGSNIIQRKQPKYIYYDVNTHGKDITLTVYIDDVAQSPTFKLNTSTRTMRRIEDIPTKWEGYRFAIKLSGEGITDDNLEIYSPFAIAYTGFGG